MSTFVGISGGLKPLHFSMQLYVIFKIQQPPHTPEGSNYQ